MDNPRPIEEADSGALDAREAETFANWVSERTPARLFVGRAGASYKTKTQLDLWRDHASAVDAVGAEIDLERDFGRELVERIDLFETQTCARTKREYLMNPELGRRLDSASTDRIATRRKRGVDVQLVIGDGLSAPAVRAQAPRLLPLLETEVQASGLAFGSPFFIRYCRVGVLNPIGELLAPSVVVLLIGERPGLATSESLSAYMAYRPRNGCTDADRNLISNIHERGTPHASAAVRIVQLALEMIEAQTSGVAIKEKAVGQTRRSPLNGPE